MSCRNDTEYLFGTRSDPPDVMVHQMMHGHSHDSAQEVPPLTLSIPVWLSRDGILDSDLMQNVLRDRALELSQNPSGESVLLIAHGPGDDMENERWLSLIGHHARAIRNAAPFARIQVETMREDWPEKRAEAEKRIRGFIKEEAASGRDVLVLPVRLFGFGPYAEVLDGLEYRADEQGLLPHPIITEWIRNEIGLARRLLNMGDHGTK